MNLIAEANINEDLLEDGDEEEGSDGEWTDIDDDELMDEEKNYPERFQDVKQIFTMYEELAVDRSKQVLQQINNKQPQRTMLLTKVKQDAEEEQDARKEMSTVGLKLLKAKGTYPIKEICQESELPTNAASKSKEKLPATENPKLNEKGLKREVIDLKSLNHKSAKELESWIQKTKRELQSQPNERAELSSEIKELDEKCPQLYSNLKACNQTITEWKKGNVYKSSPNLQKAEPYQRRQNDNFHNEWNVWWSEINNLELPTGQLQKSEDVNGENNPPLATSTSSNHLQQRVEPPLSCSKDPQTNDVNDLWAFIDAIRLQTYSDDSD